MDFQSAMETFAEAWVAANVKQENSFNNAQSEPLELTTRPERVERGERSPDDQETHGGKTEPSSPRPQTQAGHQQPPSPRPPLFEESPGQGRSLPVHCVVEAVWSLTGRDSSPPSLETDSYVIIPVSTAIQDLVSVALSRLGYTKESVAAAKGSVVIRNWRPLPFDKIAESPLMTVGDILGELTSLATLRIQIFRTKTSTLSDMKEKLLKLLLVQHHSILVASGCPLDEGLTSQLVKSGTGGSGCEEPSEETRRKFEAWWSVQQLRLARPHPPWYSPPPPPPPPQPPQAQLKQPSSDQALHPALQMVQNQHPTPKTRMRTSFDPELELPKLQQWFMENQHPSRQQIQQFVRELNSLESRRGRKPLDVNNVVYWFKNARAAQKRAEIRNLPPALQYKLMLNGYHSNSQSPSEQTAAKSPGQGSLTQDTAENMEPLLSPRASPQPADKSPLQAAESNHDGSGEDLGEHNSGIQDDHANNNNNNSSEKEDTTGEMSAEEDEEDEEEFEKDYKMSLKSEGGGGGGSGDRPGSFPIIPNSMFNHSIMYMSQYFPVGLPPPPGSGLSSLADERRKRNRTFIDPVSEVPRLEQWFSLNTHPSHALILKYTDDLNQMPYRQKFPPLEPKNVQFWFKNRRAKCKRLKMSLFDPGANSYLQPSYPHHIPSSLSGEPYQAH